MNSREMAKKRWRGVSRKKRSEQMRKLALQRWSPQEETAGGGRAELDRLFRLRFPPEGKAERVARALAALHQEPAVRGTKEEWKRIVETDVEDQY